MAAAQSNTYTVNANASDVVDFTLVTTSGSLVPKIRVYDPFGALAGSNYSGAPSYCSGSFVELNTLTLSMTGIYTVLVGDCVDTNTGNYAIYAQRMNNPNLPIPLSFGLAQAGTIGSAAQSNTYTFSANASDVIDFTLAATSGSLIPKIRVYNPDGTLAGSNYSGAPSYCSGSTVELNTLALKTTGTYTVLAGDCADTNTGNYEIYAQRTNNPSGAVPVDWGQVQAGTIGSAAQSSSYTFSGTTNDQVNFTLVTTSGSLVPKIRLYNPSGILIASNYRSSPICMQLLGV
jgi:hypothetical protein